jgi:mono/diheme cytochrome c family protein
MRANWLRFTAIALAGAALFGVSAAASAQQLTAAQTQFFENKIRPIFANHCYKCHNAAEGQSKGGLTLDTKDGLLSGGNSGPGLIAGNPDKSLIIEAVRYQNTELQMPPKGQKLSPQQVADLEQWVKMGAPDPRTGSTAKGEWKGGGDHWAFKPVVKPSVPAVPDKTWVANPIDAFILAKQDPKGLKPSPPASRQELIRRVYFDLIGLPPTPEEVKAFVEDTSPNAFEKIVDRLLKSHHYGERWGRYWLDVARYSDTKGDPRRGDPPTFPYAWTYRDYVIQSFNDDKPYDQFILEQLAADQLPAAKTNPGLLAALGFVTLGDRFDGNENEIINDRIDTTTKAFLALTVACARCHDHKFDPIPTADYYSLRGVFNSTREPREKPLIREAKDPVKYEEYKTARSKIEAEYIAFRNRELDKFQEDFLGKSTAYLVTILSPGNQRQNLMRDHKLTRETLQHWERIVRSAKAGDPIFGPWFEFRRLRENEFAAKSKDVATKVLQNKDPKNPLNRHVAAAFRIAPRNMQEVAAIYGRLFATADQAWQASVKAYEDRAKAGRAGNPPSRLGDLQMEALRTVAFTYGSNQNMEPEEAFRRLLPQRVQNQEEGFRSRLARLEMDHDGAPARAMAIEDKPRAEDSPIFVRGEPGNRGKVVPRQFLEVFSGPNRKPFQYGSGRLELARAIADKNNPITARVMVNRIWLHHFGEGIVNTPDDFGTMAEQPTHPELVDYLASYFMENGWSQKKLHKLILMSNTWRQSSADNPRHAQIDPDNRLLWRANIRRLDFEPLRDSVLHIGGILDLRPGGKPDDLTDQTNTRRSIYGYIDRANVPEVMNHFDFATPSMATGKRYQTIVPQQALFLMNSPLVVEQARRAVTRADFKKLSSDEAKIEFLYGLLYQRPPTDIEKRLAREFVASTPLQDTMPIALQTAPQPAAAQKGKAAKGKAAPAPRAPAGPQPLDAWGKLAHALFQSNEFSFVN